MFQKLWSSLRPVVSFQILSDLHLEISQQYGTYVIPICAKHLVLAGDIGRLVDYDGYREFLQKQTDRYELVFLVLGNHEFYYDSFAAGLEKARQLEMEPSLNGRLIVLHQRRFDIPGSRVTLLGCTLWSKVPAEAVDIVQSKIKDFQKIENWTTRDHNASFENDFTWLMNEILSIHRENMRLKNHSQKRSILVVTHHAPCLQKTSSPQHAQSPWRFAFGTDILSEVPDVVKIWVFGHTHYSVDFKESGIRVTSNQRGYVLPWSGSKDTKDGFNPKKVINV